MTTTALADLKIGDSSDSDISPRQQRAAANRHGKKHKKPIERAQLTQAQLPATSSSPRSAATSAAVAVVIDQSSSAMQQQHRRKRRRRLPKRASKQTASDELLNRFVVCVRSLRSLCRCANANLCVVSFHSESDSSSSSDSSLSSESASSSSSSSSSSTDKSTPLIATTKADEKRSTLSTVKSTAS